MAETSADGSSALPFLALQRLVEHLAPRQVLIDARRIDASHMSGLFDDERAHIAHAVPKRQHEFATGRALLRFLLGEDRAIPVGPNRSPDLPPGCRASLAHDNEYALAAVTRDPGIIALGVDIEPATELSSELARMILRPEETHLDAHLAFTLKEATYKAWSSMGGRMLEHSDVSLVVDTETFRARVCTEDVWFSGRYLRTRRHWLALVAVIDGPLPPGRTRVLGTRTDGGLSLTTS